MSGLNEEIPLNTFLETVYESLCSITIETASIVTLPIFEVHKINFLITQVFLTVRF